MYKQLQPHMYTVLHESIACIFLLHKKQVKSTIVKKFKIKQKKPQKTKQVRWHLPNNTLIKREELDDVLTKQELLP